MVIQNQKYWRICSKNFLKIQNIDQFVDPVSDLKAAELASGPGGHSTVLLVSAIYFYIDTIQIFLGQTVG